MQQNNVQTTITNETVTENVQEIKNNYNIQLEAMTEKLNGVLTRSKRTNQELTESQKQLGNVYISKRRSVHREWSTVVIAIVIFMT